MKPEYAGRVAEILFSRVKMITEVLSTRGNAILSSL